MRSGLLGCGSLDDFDCRCERDLFQNINAGAAYELAHGGFCKAGGVVFDAHGLLFFVECYFAYAIDLAQAGQG